MKIWQYWHDPKNVPEYIQMCMATVRLHHSDVTLLNRRDYDDLCRSAALPAVNFQKPGTQTEKIAHQVEANIMRLLLLHNYGGAWIDADIMCLHNFYEFFSEVPSNKLGLVRWHNDTKLDGTIMCSPKRANEATSVAMYQLVESVDAAFLGSANFNHTKTGAEIFKDLDYRKLAHTWPEKQMLWGRHIRDWLREPRAEMSEAIGVNFVNSLAKETLGKLTREEIMSKPSLARNMFIQAGFGNWYENLGE